MKTANKKRKQKWAVLEDSGFIIIIPEWDILPHTELSEEEIKKQKLKNVEIADAKCPCKPRISIGEKKIQIIHNSFRDAELINNSLKHFNENKN